MNTFIYLFPAAQERLAGSPAPPRPALQGAYIYIYIVYFYIHK